MTGFRGDDSRVCSRCVQTRQSLQATAQRMAQLESELFAARDGCPLSVLIGFGFGLLCASIVALVKAGAS
jgi:hypothetical protein